MKISKKVREEAAVMCQIAASNHTSLSAAHVIALNGLSFHKSDAWDLAVSAKNYVEGNPHWRPVARAGLDEYGLACAEAEALLRTGWTP